MPLLRRKQQVAIKQEAAAGTAETLAAANVIRHTGFADWDPDVTVTPRDSLSGSLSPRGSVTGARAARIRFKQYLRGTVGAPASGTNEAEHTTPFRACGITAAFSGTTPNEISTQTPSSTIISDETNGSYCTIAVYEDGKRYMIHGAQGDATVTFDSGMPVLAEYDFLGVYNEPTDAALLVPTYAAVAPPPFQAATLSVLGYATARIKTLKLSLGNSLVMRPDPNGLAGFFTAQITGRNPTGSFDPEELLAATKNYHNEFIAGAAGSITTGLFPSTGSNYNMFNLTIPAAAYIKVAKGDREGLSTLAIDFECRANSDAGEDEFSLVQS